MPDPPKKANVDHEIAAAPNAATITGPDVDSLVEKALDNPAVVDKLLAIIEKQFVTKQEQKQFVTKQEHDELKGEQKQFVTKQEHDELKGKHDELEGKFDELKSRLNGLTNVFEPSTKHALFETAIYIFVALSELPAEGPHEQEKAKYALAVLCSDILKQLLEYNPKKKLSLVGFKLGLKNNLTRKKWKTPILRALQGLVAFIDIEQKSTLEDWSSVSEKRNTVIHNGDFLDAIFGSPNGKANSNANRFTLTQEMVNKNLANWEETAKEDTKWHTVEEAVESVAKKMNLKGLDVAGKGKGSVIQELKELVMEE